MRVPVSSADLFPADIVAISGGAFGKRFVGECKKASKTQKDIHTATLDPKVLFKAFFRR